MPSVKYSLQKTSSHVNVPLIGDSVEVTPTGSILCWYWASLGCTQHRHHIVMDGSSHIKFCEKFWSADENTINLRSNAALLPHNQACPHMCALGQQHTVGPQCFKKVHSDTNSTYLCLSNQKIVAHPKPVARLRWESGCGNEDRKSLLQRPSCHVIRWLMSLDLNMWMLLVPNHSQPDKVSSNSNIYSWKYIFLLIDIIAYNLIFF